MQLNTELPNEREFTITGMDCADCALNLERGVARLSGVEHCEVNFTSGKMRITGSAEPDQIHSRIRDLGYDVADENTPGAKRPEHEGPRGLLGFLLSRRDTALALLGAALLALSLALGAAGLPAAIRTGLHLVIVLLAGVPIVLNGWRELLYSRRITINLLMSIATAGALVIGETAEAATVIVLFAIGEALEGYAADRARYSLRSLIDLVPQQATVLQPCVDCAEHLGQDGYSGGPCPFCGVHETRVPVGALQIGARVLIAPGERIPMDGVICEGQSTVNQAPVTGESMPVEKLPGAEVFAGTINGSGALEIEITRLAADNTLNRIIHMVEEAQASRAPSQRFIDRFAQWYTPLTVALALVAAFGPPLLFNAPFWDTPTERGWLYRALALLIIACPCALVISTPVTIVSALTSAARQGILIKGGAPLEMLARIRAYAFDKTGTLTSGKPVLTTAHAVTCTSDAPAITCDSCLELLAKAAAVERRSEHPVAAAVVTAAADHSLLERYPAASGVTSLAGRGVQGDVGGLPVTIGSHTFFETAFPHAPEICAEVHALEAQGQTTMLLAQDGAVQGILAVADQPRLSSKQTLQHLKALRPSPYTVMLTGDNPATAAAVAAALGVDDVRAELMPEDKLETIRSLQAQYGPTAMIGDGINDAPALAAAAIGIAMGTSGAAQAMETADVVLMQDDLRRLPDAVRISQQALRIVRQNIGLSLGIKLVVLLLALFGWSSLWMAVFADVGASLIVTGNGMRLLHHRSARVP